MREECGHTWVTSANAVLNGGTGCPTCAAHGFDSASPALLYLMRSLQLGAVKVGVAGIGSTRVATHGRHGWGLVATWDFASGGEALTVERDVLDRWHLDGLPLGFVRPSDMPQTGWTETTSLALVDIDELTAWITARAAQTIEGPSTALAASCRNGRSTKPRLVPVAKNLP